MSEAHLAETRLRSVLDWTVGYHSSPPVQALPAADDQVDVAEEEGPLADDAPQQLTYVGTELEPGCAEPRKRALEHVAEVRKAMLMDQRASREHVEVR